MLLHAAMNNTITAAESLQEDEVRSLVEEGNESERQKVVPAEK
jgi:hypothetical protein